MPIDERLRIRKTTGDRHRLSAAQRAKPRLFVGADGEGVTLPRPEPIFIGAAGVIDTVHEYRLLRVGDDLLMSDTDLTWWECLAFLSDLPKKPLYVSYFFDYDVTMMLRKARPDRVKRLLDPPPTPEGKSAFTTRGVEFPSPVGSFEVAYMPRKEFRVRRVGEMLNEPASKNPFTTISDVGSFFQSAFLRAIDDWDIGTYEQVALITKGKEERSIVDHIDKEVIRYNALEIETLQELMDKFRGTCKDVGYVPRKWQGPGHLASAMLSAHGVLTRDELMLPDKLRAIANMALHFGRFETMMTGEVPGPVYEYDITSAYPHAMRSLPCLLHAGWRRLKRRPPAGSLWLSKGKFAHPAGHRTGNLPFRRQNGSIFYPLHGGGVYWSVEIEAGERHGTVWDGLEYWVHSTSCDCRPFDWISEIFAERRRLGKSAKGKTVKLSMNSLFGKMAQTRGTGPYFNEIWCSLLTAKTRGMLTDAAGPGGHDVVMFATDALYTLNPRPHLDIGSNLGQWEETVHPKGMCIIQPGLYFSLTAPYPKTRGIPRAKVAERQGEFRDLWRKFVTHVTELRAPAGAGDNLSEELFEDYRLTIPLNVFLGLRLAHHLGKPQLAGEWVKNSKRMGFDWRNKRDLFPDWIHTFNGTYAHTHPYRGAGIGFSHPYTPAYRNEIDQQRTAEEWSRLMVQPDWADTLEGWEPQ